MNTSAADGGSSNRRGSPGPAAARAAELGEQVRESANPSALAWWHYVVGEVTGRADPAGALAAYSVAIEHATRADNRLFVMLARSSAATVLGGDGRRSVALAELGRVLDQWEDLGNTASQWWVLLSLAVLLAEFGRDGDAAVLGGAVLRNRAHRPAFVRDRQRLDGALAAVRARLGPTATDAALAEGARLSLEEAVALGRRVIREAAVGTEP